MSNRLTHFDDQGSSRMVDVGKKPVTARRATAEALIRMAPATLAAIRDCRFAKGDVMDVARLAGIMAAKRTGDLIPLCHPLPLDAVSVDLQPVGGDALRIVAEASASARTGVEMEALTAASIAALTVYDMCKSIDRGMTIEQVRLLAKSGGASGDFVACDAEGASS